MSTKIGKRKFHPLACIIFSLLFIYLFIMCVMMLWTLFTTVKTVDEYTIGSAKFDFNGNKLWLAEKGGWTLKNYITAWRLFDVKVEETRMSYNIIDQFMNSLLYSVGCAAACTVTSLVMGYATARFTYRLSGYIYAFVLVTLALPIVGSMPSEMAVADALNLLDTFPGLWIMRANFLNTYFLIFFAQFKMIPMDYTEAAKIDGANPFAIMCKIIVPLAMGTISTVFVLSFITYWNDYQIPMLYLPSHPVAAWGMYRFVNEPLSTEISNTPTRLAGVCLMALPIVVFYAAFNKKLNVNLSVGGIKG